MKLDYIYHSGFAIEADGVTVIIDYYKDSSEEVYSKGIVHDSLLERPGVLYVLCTHFHPDHFNREVLTWKSLRPDIRYIFSKDVLDQHRASAEDAIYIDKGDFYEDENIRVKAFGSTDVGSSFLIDLQGKRLFHAGDLKDLQDTAPTVDLAMFPVDSRIGKDYMRGAEQFVERIKTTIFVPMHFSEDYQGGNAFQSFAESKGCRFLNITHRGQHFSIENS